MGNVHIQMQKLIMVLVSLHWAKFTALQIERFIFLSFILTHVFLKSDFNHSKLKSYSVMRCWIILLDFVCCLIVICHHCDTINAAHTLNHGSANKIPNWDRHTLSMDAIRFNQHSNALQCSWYEVAANGGKHVGESLTSCLLNWRGEARRRSFQSQSLARTLVYTKEWIGRVICSAMGKH